MATSYLATAFPGDVAHSRPLVKGHGTGNGMFFPRPHFFFFGLAPALHSAANPILRSRKSELPILGRRMFLAPMPDHSNTSGRTIGSSGKQAGGEQTPRSFGLRTLRAGGWRVLRVWEHELADQTTEACSCESNGGYARARKVTTCPAPLPTLRKPCPAKRIYSRQTSPGRRR